MVTVHTDDKSYRGGVGAESIKGRTEQDQLLTYDRIFPKLYQSLKPVNVPEGATSFTCDLAVDPGGSVLLQHRRLSRVPGDQRGDLGPEPGGDRPRRPQPLQRERRADWWARARQAANGLDPAAQSEDRRRVLDLARRADGVAPR